MHDLEADRQAIQGRLDAARPAADRNRLGQFATPPGLALDLARYSLHLWQDRDDLASFLDPAVGTGSFYSALRRTFPPGRLPTPGASSSTRPSLPPLEACGTPRASG